jgi:cytochrome c553
MDVATPQTVLGDFSGVTVTDGRHTASFRREGDKFLVRTDGPGGAVAEFAVSETFGADPLQQYLVLFPDGRRQALPWAWDSRPGEQGGQRWFHLMAHADLHAGDTLHWTGRDQNWNFMCAACHSTGLVRGYDAGRDRFDTSWTEISVGCESCHGPGASHVAWARASPHPDVPGRGLSVALRDAAAGGWRCPLSRPAPALARSAAPRSPRRPRWRGSRCPRCSASSTRQPSRPGPSARARRWAS